MDLGVCAERGVRRKIGKSWGVRISRVRVGVYNDSGLRACRPVAGVSGVSWLRINVSIRWERV